MTDKRIYTHVSEKAVKGLQRIARNREVFVQPTADGYNVVTASRDKMPKPKRAFA